MQIGVFEKNQKVCSKGYFEKKLKVYAKGEDNQTHHPYHSLEWDSPPGVFSSKMVEGE